MTALMGLRTRLALAGVALSVPADRSDPELLEPLVEAGVDLLILGGSGDADQDVATLEAMRSRWAGRPLLLGTANRKVAAPAAADVVHLRRPGWRFWGYPRGHEWGLLGRHAEEGSVVEAPGSDFDYLFIPVAGATDPLLAEAILHQPPLTEGAVPWFALGDPDQHHLEALLGAGVRRVALSAQVLDAGDAVGRVRAVAGAVEQAWREDERSRAYRLAAMRH